jgi:hypothetical protein
MDRIARHRAHLTEHGIDKDAIAHAARLARDRADRRVLRLRALYGRDA